MTTPTLTPAKHAVARHLADRVRDKQLAELRRFVDREHAGGATVIRIEHIRAYLGWTA